jgi:hypothetical protein
LGQRAANGVCERGGHSQSIEYVEPDGDGDGERIADAQSDVDGYAHRIAHADTEPDGDAHPGRNADADRHAIGSGCERIPALLQQ